jgi:iron(III) transport system substrate-binding protein
MNKVSKNLVLCLIVIAMMTGLTGCGGSNAPSKSPEPAKKVVIYTNADKEATDAMEKSLKEAGYDGKYVLQTLGTSELGGKLMAEGDKIEANLVTMSSYFLDSAQNKYKMFADLTFETKALMKHPAYYAPILANTGAIFVNTQVLKEKNLPIPKSVKDLTHDRFKDQVSIPNIMNSSTAWLLIQSIISQ